MESKMENNQSLRHRCAAGSSKLLFCRHKCAACYRQFNKIEHLVEHMKISNHSEHEPVCPFCNKHVRSLDSLREHLIGPLPKVECAKLFSKSGCNLCFNVFSNSQELHDHQSSCKMCPPDAVSCAPRMTNQPSTPNSAVAISCTMVGGGHESSLDLCAKICIVDEDEKVLIHTYVKPQSPVSYYRYESTGIKPEVLKNNAMPWKQLQEILQNILYNGQVQWRAVGKGTGRVIVGYELDHLLQVLNLELSSQLKRDIAKYPPLIKTNKASNTLKTLTQSILGYEIQRYGKQDAFEEAIAAMRTYKRMKTQGHPYVRGCASHTDQTQLSSYENSDLEKLTPEALLQLSRCDYYCWCLDI